MKKILSIIIVLSLVAPAAAGAATIGKPVSNQGLVGHWSFDEGSGTVAHNLLDGNNSGTLTSGPTWSAGRKGGALSFDGSDDSVDVADTDAFSSSNFTLSIWVKWDGVRYASGVTKDWAAPIAKGAFASGEYTILIHRDSAGTDTDVRFYINGTTQVVWANSQIDTNWHLLTATYNGSVARIYFDGVEKANASVTPVVPNSANSLTIGRSQNVGYLWGGRLDDARVYNRALSASEVAALYGSVQSSHSAATKTGLAAHWSFNEGSGAIAHDQSGNGMNASLGGTASWSNGRLGKAMSLQGGLASGYASASGLSIPVNGPVTISGWFYPTTTALARGTSAHLFEDLYQHPVNNMFYLGNGADFFSVTANDFAVNRWHHVVLTYNGQHNTAVLYLDGVQFNVNIQTPGQNHLNMNSFYIGSDQSGGGGTFPGSIDDVRIYNRVLTQSEALALYKAKETIVNQSQNNQLAEGLVGFWTFNGQDAQSTIADVSGQGNHGYFVGGATSTAKTIGKVGQAFTFDGVDDRVTIPDNSSLDIGTNSLTISSWVKLRDVSGARRIVSKRSGGLGAGYSLVVGGDGVPYIEILSASTYIMAYGPIAIDDNRWHHVVGVIDRMGMGYVCVDGSCATSVNFSSMSSADLSNSHTLSMSYLPDCGCALWKGEIDEVRIYNRALSVGEAKRLYNMGR